MICLSATCILAACQHHETLLAADARAIQFAARAGRGAAPLVSVAVGRWLGAAATFVAAAAAVAAAAPALRATRRELRSHTDALN